MLSARSVEVTVEPIVVDPSRHKDEAEGEVERPSLLKTKGQDIFQSLQVVPEADQSAHYIAVALAQLKRDLESQQEALAEVARQQLRLCDFEGRVEAELTRLSWQSLGSNQATPDRRRGECDTAQLSSIMAEWEHQKAQFAMLEVSFMRVREEVANTRELQRLQGSQVETLVREIRSNVDSLREETHQWGHSSDEVHTLHKDIMRSTSALGRNIEDVAAAIKSTEVGLRQEIAEARRELEEADAEQRAEILQASRCGPQLEPLNARLDALRMDFSQFEAVAAKESAALRSVLDGMSKDISRLQMVATEDCRVQANAANMAEKVSHTAHELVATTMERLDSLESALASLEVAEASRPSNEGTRETRSSDRVATKQDIQDVWDVLSMLKASLQAREAAVRAEEDTLYLEVESQGLSLISRVEALEGQGTAQKALATRLERLAESFQRCLEESQSPNGDNAVMSVVREMSVCLAGTPSTAPQAPEEFHGNPPGKHTSSAAIWSPKRTMSALTLCTSRSVKTERGLSVDGCLFGDLTPVAVAQIPTPQGMSAGTMVSLQFESSAPMKECIRV